MEAFALPSDCNSIYIHIILNPLERARLLRIYGYFHESQISERRIIKWNIVIKSHHNIHNIF